ncbi:MAG: hypothetical protein V1835_03655 [Candidatus Micrarchaeota archaeon]
MRFFKHGDSLAIVLPEKLRKGSEVKEDEEYEFFEAEKGTFILISKGNLEGLAKKSVWADLVKGSAMQNPQGTEQKQTLQITGPKPVVGLTDDAEPEKLIATRGFAVISAEEEARRISKLFEKEIKANEVMGVRGFDKKFYIVSGQFFRQNAFKILKMMGSKEMALKDISFSMKIDERGCLACLMLLKEQGEVIEKRRNEFKAIK